MILKEILVNLNSENLKKLYTLYRQPIFLFVLGITKNYDLSEDITEEVFVRVIKYHKTYNILKNPKTWLFTIAKNTTYTFLKKNKDILYENEELEKVLNQHNKIKNNDSLIVEEYLSYLCKTLNLNKSSIFGHATRFKMTIQQSFEYFL